MSEPNPFGLIRELATVETRVRRHLGEARSDIHAVVQWLADPEADIGPEERQQVVSLLKRAEAAIRKVAD